MNMQRVKKSYLLGTRVILFVFIMNFLNYGRSSKILNTSCLSKRPRQTGEAQKKQSDQGLTCLPI